MAGLLQTDSHDQPSISIIELTAAKSPVGTRYYGIPTAFLTLPGVQTAKSHMLGLHFTDPLRFTV
jgi:hypothetical protein